MNNSDFFKNIAQKLAEKAPFVIYRKPNENEVFGIIQNSNDLIEVNSFDQKGFIFCPFNNSEKSYIIPSENSKLFTTNVEGLNINSSISEFKITSSSKEKKEYEHLIQNTVNYINETEVEKVVISRKEEVEVVELDVLESYKKMIQKYNNAFVYCWYHPKVGLWMGASPERLIQIDEDIFKTMSLASTKNYEGTLNVNWSIKELEEQKIVTDYILNNLKPILSEIKTKGPYTIKAGSLLHLRTDITSKVSVSTLEKLINKLHPTPAVCGMPKDSAKDFILENEGYNRKYYTGFLGELNINNSTNLFVNLRCMQVNENNVSIYVGGGITAKSNPTKEWDETMFKSNIIKQIL